LLEPVKSHKFHFFNGNGQLVYVTVNDQDKRFSKESLKWKDGSLVFEHVELKDVCASKAIIKPKSRHRHYCRSFTMAIVELGKIHNFSLTVKRSMADNYVRSPVELFHIANYKSVDKLLFADIYFDCVVYCTGHFTNNSYSKHLTFWSAPFSIGVWILACSIPICFTFCYSI